MKGVLETVDRDGVAFLECETRSPGQKPAPRYWLCDVTRILDVIDEERSCGEILDDGTTAGDMTLRERPALSLRKRS